MLRLLAMTDRINPETPNKFQMQKNLLLFISTFLLCSLTAPAQETRKVAPQLPDSATSLIDSMWLFILNVPKPVHDSCIRGTVIINFLVRTDGTIDSFVTKHKVHPLLDEAAYKALFQTNGRWKPGTRNGIAVNMRKTMDFPFQMAHAKTLSRFFTTDNPLLAGWLQNCMDGDDHYKAGLKYWKEQDYPRAWKSFDRATRTDHLHLDAIDMLRKSSDKLGLPCDVCKKLALLADYSDREIKRIRDQYCTKDFKPLDKPVDANTVYQFLDNMPQPKSSLEDYLRANLKYSAAAKENCTQGTVLTRFVVSETGAVDSIVVTAPVEATLDEEAVRVVGTMKDLWQPGTLEGKPVKTFYTLPVRFVSDHPSCHSEEWYYQEGEKLYEQDKMTEALTHFRQAFKMNRTNYQAGYNYAAVAISLGQQEEACQTIQYLVNKGYTAAGDLAKEYCK
jgi:TonB family protein